MYDEEGLMRGLSEVIRDPIASVMIPRLNRMIAFISQLLQRFVQVGEIHLPQKLHYGPQFVKFYNILLTASKDLLPKREGLAQKIREGFRFTLILMIAPGSSGMRRFNAFVETLDKSDPLLQNISIRLLPTEEL